MNRQRYKRRITARLLLLVFALMLLLTSVHVHRAMPQITTECTACLHHIHHNGHINSIDNQVDNCLLCQFLSLPFLGAKTLDVSLFNIVKAKALILLQQVLTSFTGQTHSTRAPPFILLHP